jgi:hypothetical protein
VDTERYRNTAASDERVGGLKIGAMILIHNERNFETNDSAIRFLTQILGFQVVSLRLHMRNDRKRDIRTSRRSE